MGNFDFFMSQEKKKVHVFKSLCPPICLNVPQWDRMDNDITIYFVLTPPLASLAGTIYDLLWTADTGYLRP